MLWVTIRSWCGGSMDGLHKDAAAGTEEHLRDHCPVRKDRAEQTEDSPGNSDFFHDNSPLRSTLGAWVYLRLFPSDGNA